jgi:hypothetical protein
MKLLQNQDTEEIVEDSEPERAQLRIRNRTLGRVTYHNKANLLNDSRTLESSHRNVVESPTVSTAVVEIAGQ